VERIAECYLKHTTENNNRFTAVIQVNLRYPAPSDIGVTSYGALGHVPPLELGHVKKIWQFLR